MAIYFIYSRRNGFPDDGSTAALVSGCYMSAYALGGAIGPPVAGVLYDAYGFRYADLIFTIINAILVSHQLSEF